MISYLMVVFWNDYHVFPFLWLKCSMVNDQLVDGNRLMTVQFYVFRSLSYQDPFIALFPFLVLVGFLS